MQIVCWIARMGGVGADQVMTRFKLGRSQAYLRLSGAVREGLLEQRSLIYGQAAIYSATLDGLRWVGLERLGVYRVKAAGFEHARQVTAAAIPLERDTYAASSVLA